MTSFQMKNSFWKIPENVYYGFSEKYNSENLSTQETINRLRKKIENQEKIIREQLLLYNQLINAWEEFRTKEI